MKGERHEVDHGITKPSKCETREQMRADIEAQIVEFLKKKKNKIKEVPRGVSGFIPKPTRHLAPVAGKKSVMETLAKNSKAKYSSRVWNDGGSVVK